MKEEANKFNKKFKSFYPNEEEYWELRRKFKMRGASVHETMGPNWKDIYWTPNKNKNFKRPLVIVNTK